MRVCTRNRLLIFSLLTSLLALAGCHSSSEQKSGSQSLSDRDRDGLIGNVKAVLTADVVLNEQNGQRFEGQQASSTAIYDESGKRISQSPFRVSMPNGYAITQHELFFDPAKDQGDSAAKTYVQYDDKGNVTEKGSDVNGKKLAEVAIQYEFDSRGNWIKRSIARLTEQNGQKTLLPAEVSHRYIVYFGDVSKPLHWSDEPSAPKSPVASTAENIDAGRAIFFQKCAVCHGENGKAQTEFAAVMPNKPADLTSQPVRDLTEGFVYSVISGGINTSGMPAFKGRISDDATWQLALFVKQLSRNQVADSSAVIAKASPPPRSISPDAERRYSLSGRIVSVESELHQVMIEHDEIKGYMEAMTMPFPLKDEKMLGRLKKGDNVQATLVIGGPGGWRLENFTIK